jgi:ADP-heptose:LPS heptosyltransferase
MAVTTKLLFIETFLLGDLIYLGALLCAVRAASPDAKIEVLASTATRGFPFFEQLNVKIHYFDFPWSSIGWHKQPAMIKKACVNLKRQFERQFSDYIMLDPRGDARHTLVSYLIRPNRFIQYHSGAKWRDTLRGILPRHIFLCHEEFLHQITEEYGLLSGKFTLPWPWLQHFNMDCQKGYNRNILLAPEASNRLRYWKSDSWKQLSIRLQQKGKHVTLVTHKNDALSPEEMNSFDTVWRGSLIELARLISTSQVVIAVDSFVGHLAAAIGTPVVSLFGPQIPERWRPWGCKTSIVAADGYSCRPCNQKICVSSEYSCMGAIQVDQVMSAYNKLLDS